MHGRAARGSYCNIRTSQLIDDDTSIIAKTLAAGSTTLTFDKQSKNVNMNVRVM